MNLPRSTYYYRAVAKPEGLSDAELTSIIEDIQDELPRGLELRAGHVGLQPRFVRRLRLATFAEELR